MPRAAASRMVKSTSSSQRSDSQGTCAKPSVSQRSGKAMELISTPPKPARCIESSSRTISLFADARTVPPPAGEELRRAVGRAEFLVEFVCGNLFQEGVARQVAPFGAAAASGAERDSAVAIPKVRSSFSIIVFLFGYNLQGKDRNKLFRQQGAGYGKDYSFWYFCYRF